MKQYEARVFYAVIKESKPTAHGEVEIVSLLPLINQNTLGTIAIVPSQRVARYHHNNFWGAGGGGCPIPTEVLVLQDTDISPLGSRLISTGPNLHRQKQDEKKNQKSTHDRPHGNDCIILKSRQNGCK